MKKSEQPFALYERIKQSIIEDIDAGRLRPDDRVASETRLAKAFNASRMTANRALKELTEENRIIRVQGVGTFVARPKPDAALLEIKSISREIRDWGGSHSCEILLLAEEDAPKEIAEKLDLSGGDPVFHSILVHRDRETPVQYSERFINPAVAPDYLEQDFTRTTPSQYLLDTAPVQEAEHIIEAVACPAKIRKILKIGPHTPCLRLTRRTWSFDRVATYSIMLSPGDRYQLKGKFIRG